MPKFGVLSPDCAITDGNGRLNSLHHSSSKELILVGGYPVEKIDPRL